MDESNGMNYLFIVSLAGINLNEFEQECSVRIERIEPVVNGDETIEEKENTNTQNKLNESNGKLVSCSPPKRYRTRSSVTKTETQEIERKRQRNDSNPVDQPKPAFIEYKGKVDYFTEFFDIAFASDTLL